MKGVKLGGLSLVWLLLISPAISIEGEDEGDIGARTVTLKNGNRVHGLVQKSLYTNKRFIEFRGMRYGRAERFKVSKPDVEVWGEESRGAEEYGPVCPQIDVMREVDEEEELEMDPNDRVIGEEDCLFINVATPTIKREAKLPVAVWIHGGSYQYESGDAYGPLKFLEHDLVLVTFNFRIGLLGFLNLGHEGALGNMGLKDQVVALKWVRDNIEAFGGNASSVTLLGVNSGAVSVHLHMLSEMSEGLFHRAVLQSGSALAPWAMTRNSSKIGYLTWRFFEGCKNVSSFETCILGANVNEIVLAQERLVEWFIDPIVAVGPSIETFGEDRFLSSSPFRRIESGEFWAKDRVPLVAGVNSHEGLLHSVDIAFNEHLTQVFNMEWLRAAPITLMLRETTNNFEISMLCSTIRDYYFGRFEDDVTAEGLRWVGRDLYKFDLLTSLYSDRFFNIPLHYTAKLHTRTSSSPFYLYWFDYQGTQSSTFITRYNYTLFGVSHYDQLQYMFNTPYFNETEVKEDVEFGQGYLADLAAFIITGEPSESRRWIEVSPEMTEGRIPLLLNRIGDKKKVATLVSPFEERVEFWEGLAIREYFKTPGPDYDPDAIHRELAKIIEEHAQRNQQEL